MEQVGLEGWECPIDVRVEKDSLPQHCCHLPGCVASIAQERGASHQLCLHPVLAWWEVGHGEQGLKYEPKNEVDKISHDLL